MLVTTACLQIQGVRQFHKCESCSPCWLFLACQQSGYLLLKDIGHIVQQGLCESKLVWDDHADTVHDSMHMAFGGLQWLGRVRQVHGLVPALWCVAGCMHCNVACNVSGLDDGHLVCMTFV